MNSDPPLTDTADVHIIDDDEAFSQGLRNLLASGGIASKAYLSPQKFIEHWALSDRGCVLLDIRFPGASGLDLLDMLGSAHMTMPVILMTGHADVPSSVRGLKGGAIDYLLKPIEDVELFEAVRIAFDRDAAQRSREANTAAVSNCYTSLTLREKEVFALVCQGLMNKQIANCMQLSEITAKVHRGTMMRKMGVRTVADLVRAHETLKAGQAAAAAKTH